MPDRPSDSSAPPPTWRWTRGPTRRLGWLAALVLLACAPQRVASRPHFTADARKWARRSGIDVAPLRLAEGARILALGEAAHGAREVFVARAAWTMALIDAGWASALILEADAWSTRGLDAYVRGHADDLEGALQGLPGLYGHDDALRFFEALRRVNDGREADAKVRVVGMDASTLAACAASRRAGDPEAARRCDQARALSSALELGETYWVRDEIMAENVAEVAARSPGGVVVWVHAGHAARSAPLLLDDRRRSTAPMGWFLQRRFGAAYRAATITFQEGSVAVQALVGGLFPRLGAFAEVEVGPADAATIEGMVRFEGDAPVLLDLRELPRGAASTAWFASPQSTRSIGGAERLRALRGRRAAHGWAKYVPREAFDFVIVLPRSGPLELWVAGSGRRGPSG
ncbi:MAG: erythromycin esterase family protein [Nannocystaceae bacterium]